MKKSLENLAIEEPPPPRMSMPANRALLWHGLGFFTIVIVLWSAELFSFLYNYFGGDWREVDVADAATRTVVVVFIWIFFARKIHQVLSRLTYLESFMHFCSWCNKVEKGSKWLTLEEHFTQQTGKRPSHGMCPDCAHKFIKDAVTEEPVQDSTTGI
ncbi:MAG: hypothetical protein ISQ14_13995 [Verrucomicrobiae bacterium]|nr:hypothetical protein [Verrucomicrobiae bacterium]